jgi:GNAT superfamily N-acetyltransferase
VTERQGEQGLEFRAVPIDSEPARMLLSMAEVPDSERLLPSDENPPDEDFTSDNDGVFLIAYVNGRPTGCGGYRVYPGDQAGDTAEIARMYVHPGSRHTGLGRAILAELERWAADDGFREVVLRARYAQAAARALVAVSGYHQGEPTNGQSGHLYGKSLRGTEDSKQSEGADAGPAEHPEA